MEGKISQHGEMAQFKTQELEVGQIVLISSGGENTPINSSKSS